MSKIADAEANATSLDGLVNDNGLIPTLRNGPKPSWQYLVDGWESQFTTLFADGEIQIDQIVTDLQTLGDAELSSLLIGITSQADSAIAGIQSDVSEKLEQVTIEADEAIESIQNDTASAIASAQNRTDAAVDQLTNDANELLDNIEQSALSRSKVSTPVTLSQGQTEITIAGFNASLSAYYVKDLNSDAPRYRLFSGANEDYTFDSVTTDTITLNQTYDAGTKVYAVSLDPAGAGVIKTDSQFSSVVDLRLSDVSVGTTATIPSLGNARYFITTGVTPLIGDIDFLDTRVGVLLPDDNQAFDVRWFGAVSGAAAQAAIFENAAIHARDYANDALSSNNRGNVSVPVGNWVIEYEIATEANWFIYGEIQGNPNYPGNNSDNLDRLNGRVYQTKVRGSGQLRVGATDVQWLQDIRTSILGTSSLECVSGTGQPGALFASRSSDGSGGTEGTIAAKFYVVNDNTSTQSVSYATYMEATKGEGAGTTFCGETNVTPYGTFRPIYPHLEYGNAAGITANHLFGGPVGSGAFDDTQTKTMTSAVAYISGGSAYRDDDPTKKYGFDAGFVFLNAAFETSEEKEIIRAGDNMKIAWFDTDGNRSTWIEGAGESGGNIHRISLASDSGGANTVYRLTNSEFACNKELALGTPNDRFSTGYFVNSPNVVSDRDKKTEIRGLTSDELNAGLELARNVKFFKWIDEVNKKGSENSYLHASVIAQEAYDILKSNNLDAKKYGLVSSQSGNWSVLPTELNMLMSAALVAEQDKIKSRLDALEA
ncbi:hypothetical protein [Pseudoalteromonas phage XCL1123]|nr:hypothetical protein [Pseudoalteromonas phage XCL1123]